MERLTDPVTYRPQDQETKIPKTENERQLNRRDRRTDMNFSDSEAGNGGPARASERASAAGYVSSARSRATEAHSENKSRESAIITRQTVIGPIGRCGGAARSAGEGLGWGCLGRLLAAAAAGGVRCWRCGGFAWCCVDAVLRASAVGLLGLIRVPAQGVGGEVFINRYTCVYASAFAQ